MLVLINLARQRPRLSQIDSVCGPTQIWSDMPELLEIPSQLDRPGSKTKRKRREEKEALVFVGSDDTEKRVRPSRYAAFFEGSSVGEYLYSCKLRQEVIQQLKEEGDQIQEEDPERYAELLTLKDVLQTEELPHFKKRYHEDILEEAKRTVHVEPPNQDVDGIYFELSEEDRVRLEAMFLEMTGASARCNEDEAHSDSSVDGDGEECELEASEEEDDEGSYDEEALSDSASPGLEAEVDNRKPRGHFSRWDKDPKKMRELLNNDRKEQKFKPRMNVVWQQRLQQSKVKRNNDPIQLASIPPPPKNSLFDSIMPRRYRRKTKSRLPNIVVSTSRRQKPEAAPRAIGQPRQNRSSELRLQKRLMQEALEKEQFTGRRGLRRLRRSQSHVNVAKEPSTQMRRATSLRSLPFRSNRQRGRNSDNGAANKGTKQKRKSTPHPGRKVDDFTSEPFDDANDESYADDRSCLEDDGSCVEDYRSNDDDDKSADDDRSGLEDEEDEVSSPPKSAVSNSHSDTVDDDIGVPPVSV